MGLINKLGVFGDVHDDYESLCKALSALEECDKIVHLGDVVNGEHISNKIIDVLISNGIKGVMGNHDELSLKVSYSLDDKSKEYLSSLPTTMSLGNVLLVHDHPLDKEKNQWMDYHEHKIKTSYVAKNVFEETKFPVMIIGHTHTQECFCYDGEVSQIEEDMVHINPSKRYILNAGPVYSDHLRPSSVGIYDFKERTFLIKYIEIGDAE